MGVWVEERQRHVHVCWKCFSLIAEKNEQDLWKTSAKVGKVVEYPIKGTLSDIGFALRAKLINVPKGRNLYQR